MIISPHKNEKQDLFKKTSEINRRLFRISVFCLLLIATTAVLVAAFLHLYFTIRPGLHNETCVSRDCMNSFGLICIDNICQCNPDNYYQKECQNKKTYMEKCNNDSNQCQNGENLQCKDGICKCNDISYWNGMMCVVKKSHKEWCTANKQCLENLMLTCDTTNNMCDCDPLRFNL